MVGILYVPFTGVAKDLVVCADHLEVGLRLGGEEMTAPVLEVSHIGGGDFSRSRTMCLMIISPLDDPMLHKGELEFSFEGS